MKALLRAAVALSALCGTMAASAAPGDPGRDKVALAINANHDASLKRLRDWIKLPTIANMNINHREGAESDLKHRVVHRRPVGQSGTAF